MFNGSTNNFWVTFWTSNKLENRPWFELIQSSTTGLRPGSSSRSWKTRVGIKEAPLFEALLKKKLAASMLSCLHSSVTDCARADLPAPAPPVSQNISDMPLMLVLLAHLSILVMIACLVDGAHLGGGI